MLGEDREDKGCDKDASDADRAHAGIEAASRRGNK